MQERQLLNVNKNALTNYIKKSLDNNSCMLYNHGGELKVEPLSRFKLSLAFGVIVGYVKMNNDQMNTLSRLLAVVPSNDIEESRFIKLDDVAHTYIKRRKNSVFSLKVGDQYVFENVVLTRLKNHEAAFNFVGQIPIGLLEKFIEKETNTEERRLINGEANIIDSKVGSR